jgi:hypothetical protein
MPISRILYVGQEVRIDTNSGQSTLFLPVSSASCEVTKPIEAVSAFGHLGSLALAQTNLTTCKATVKTYLTSGIVSSNTGGGGYAGTGPVHSGLSSTGIGWLTGDAINGTLTALRVSPNGFAMSGILTSLGIDMALGGFGTADVSFNGLGQPWFDPTPTSSASIEKPNMPNAIVPVTTIAVADGLTGVGCTTSFKFALDMPTDNLACLGSDPDAVQSTSQQSLISTKPPYKATITVEGFGVDIQSTTSAASNLWSTGNWTLGGLKIRLPNAKVTSKSFNNAVGAAGATYNFTAEDTSATFTN